MLVTGRLEVKQELIGLSCNYEPLQCPMCHGSVFGQIRMIAATTKQCNDPFAQKFNAKQIDCVIIHLLNEPSAVVRDT